MQEVDSLKIIDFVDEDKALAILKSYPHAILHVTNPTERMIIQALRIDSSLLADIKNPSDKAITTALKSDGLAIAYVAEQKRKYQIIATDENQASFIYLAHPCLDVLEKVCNKYQEDFSKDDVSMRSMVIKVLLDQVKEKIEMVTKNILNIVSHLDAERDADEIKRVLRDHPSAIKLIDNATESLWLYAIRKSPTVIKHCSNQTERMQKCAVSRLAYTIMHCHNPSVDVMRLAVKTSPAVIMILKDAPAEIYIDAIKRNARSYLNLKNPTEEDTIAYIQNPSSDMQHIKHLSNKVLVQAVKTNPTRIKEIIKPSNEVLEALIDTDPKAISMVYGYVPEHLQMKAIKKDPSVIHGMFNLSESVKQYAYDVMNNIDNDDET